jgi:predicted phosphodiesterase
MKRVLIIGDTHGKMGGYFDRLDEFVESNSNYLGDLYSLQIGDFGFEDNYRQRENWFEKSAKYDSKNHVFFGGNHDEYPIPEWTNGLGHFGEVPFIPNSFFVRGAKSVDEEARTAGHDWWPEEQLNWMQSKNALEKYIDVEPKYMFSHDAPQEAAEKMFFWKDPDETNTSKLLQEMFEAHKPDLWIFGHWHISTKTQIENTTFRCLDELETMILEFENHEY